MTEEPVNEALYTAQLQGSLLLSSDGVWFHNGQPFQNPKLSDLFLRSIVWDSEKQQYFVQIGRQRAAFSHSGVVYFAQSIDDSKSPWILRLSSGAEIPLDPSTLFLSAGDVPVCAADGGHRVRFLRGAHQVLARHVVSEQSVEIGGTNYPLTRRFDEP